MTRNNPALFLFTAILSVLLLPAAALAQGTLFVVDDKVGVGTDAPADTVHVTGADGLTKFLVQETSATVAPREIFRLENNGGPFFIFADNSLSQSYSFAMGATGDFLLSHQQTAGVQMRLKPNGNLTITGILTEGSSRSQKEDIQAVSGSRILQQVLDLPLATWRYKADGSGRQHLGPMAEDFHAAFSLGAEDGISSIDTSGVALAAIQGLYDLVEEQKAEIQRLNERIQQLERGGGH